MTLLLSEAWHGSRGAVTIARLVTVMIVGRYEKFHFYCDSDFFILVERLG
jgi:hypothetical protein